MLQETLIEKYPALLIFNADQKEFCIGIDRILFISSAQEFVNDFTRFKTTALEHCMSELFYVADFNSIFGFTSSNNKGKEKIIFIESDDESLGVKVESVTEFIITDKNFFKESNFIKFRTHNYLRGKILYQDREFYLPDYDKIISDHKLHISSHTKQINRFFVSADLS